MISVHMLHVHSTVHNEQDCSSTKRLEALCCYFRFLCQKRKFHIVVRIPERIVLQWYFLGMTGIVGTCMYDIRAICTRYMQIKLFEVAVPVLLLRASVYNLCQNFILQKRMTALHFACAKGYTEFALEICRYLDCHIDFYSRTKVCVSHSNTCTEYQVEMHYQYTSSVNFFAL